MNLLNAGCGDCDPCLGGRPDQCAIFPQTQKPIIGVILKDKMQIPKEIIEAAQKIHNWATEQGMERYEIGPICSRNFADDSRAIKRAELYLLSKIANQGTVYLAHDEPD